MPAAKHWRVLVLLSALAFLLPLLVILLWRSPADETEPAVVTAGSAAPQQHILPSTPATPRNARPAKPPPLQPTTRGDPAATPAQTVSPLSRRDVKPGGLITSAPAAETEPVVLGAGNITGRVLNLDLAAGLKLVVGLLPESGDESARGKGVPVDEQGVFNLSAVPAGRWSLLLFAAEDNPAETPPLRQVAVEVQAGETAKAEVPLASGGISGNLEGPEGKLPADLQVLVLPRGQPGASSPLNPVEAALGQALLKEAAFELRELQPGQYQLMVRETGAEKATAPLVVDFDLKYAFQLLNLGTLRLEPGRTVAGTVLDPSGLPVNGAEIQAELSSGQPLLLSAMSSSDGRFSLGTLPPEPLRLRVGAENFAPAFVDETPGPVEVRLTPGGTLVVKVEGSQGNDCKVRLSSSEGRPLLMCLPPVEPGGASQVLWLQTRDEATGEGGSVTFQHLASGDYQVALVPIPEAGAEQMTPAEAINPLPVSLREGETTETSLSKP